MLKIKKNDAVICLTGKDKGKKGKVLSIIPTQNKAIVEGINFIKKHTRKTREDQQGGIIERESPIQLSNLALICSKCNKATKVGFTTLKDGSKVRKCKKCDEVLG